MTRRTLLASLAAIAAAPLALLKKEPRVFPIRDAKPEIYAGAADRLRRTSGGQIYAIYDLLTGEVHVLPMSCDVAEVPA